MPLSFVRRLKSLDFAASKSTPTILLSLRLSSPALSLHHRVLHMKADQWSHPFFINEDALGGRRHHEGWGERGQIRGVIESCELWQLFSLTLIIVKQQLK